MVAMKSQKSFTLIELLVTVTIFSLIVGAASGVFVSALRAQRKSLSMQELLGQTSFLMEYMSRAIRMAKKELSAPACLSQNGLNYEIPVGYRIDDNEDLGWKIKFKNYQGICQEFFWDKGTNQLMENKTGYTEPLPLTSPSLRINSLSFNLIGKSQFDDPPLQPRVTIFLKIEGKEKSKINLQTTISQRNPDIPK